jgi:hypothetical protein
MRTSVLLERAARPRDSRIIVASEQDVAPVLEHNAALRAETQTSDWGRHVASVPAVILVQWANESGLRPFTAEFNELVQRKLQDPDWAYLRTG